MSSMTPELRRTIDGLWKSMNTRKREKEENNGHRRLPESVRFQIEHELPYFRHKKTGEGGTGK